MGKKFIVFCNSYLNIFEEYSSDISLKLGLFQNSYQVYQIKAFFISYLVIFTIFSNSFKKK